jgi:hypothetical protein
MEAACQMPDRLDRHHIMALLGAGLSFVQTRRLQRRQAWLARLNAQLEELYGPIYATLEASRIAYHRLLDKLRPGSVSLFDPGSAPPSEEELCTFRRWIETVSHPRATEAYERIINKAHLLIEDEMLECLLTFCAHKAGYDVLIQRWHSQDFTEHLSVVRHPGNRLYEYLEQSFTRLKQEQGEELAATQGKIGRRQE